MTAQILRIGDDIIAIHAIVTDEGVTLIDAGLSGDLGILRKALATVGRDIADIRGVVLTHGDDDHIGIAEELRSPTAFRCMCSNPMQIWPRARSRHEG